MLRRPRRAGRRRARSAASRCRAWRRSAFGVMRVDDERPHHRASWRSRTTRPRCPAGPTRARPAWASTSSTPTSCTTSCGDDAADPNSSHDFGKDIIPRHGPARQGDGASASPAPASRRARERAVLARRRHGRRVLERQHRPDATRCRSSTSTTATGRSGPTRSTPPAKFVLDEDGRRGMAIDSLVSGGCIVSGAGLHARCCSPACGCNSCAELDEAVILPDVEVGRGAGCATSIVDRGCASRPASSSARTPSSTPAASGAPRRACA